MFKMGSHDPFGYLQHKLWPKERLGVKLPIRLLTTKSQESLWCPCVQVVCHMPLKSSRWRLQLSLRPHLNRRSAHKVMGLQNCKRLNFENFGTPTWEAWDKMTFGCWPTIKHREYYKAEGGGFPQVWVVVSLVSSCLPVTRLCTKNVPTTH